MEPQDRYAEIPLRAALLKEGIDSMVNLTIQSQETYDLFIENINLYVDTLETLTINQRWGFYLDTLSEKIGELKKLRELDVEFGKITSLPDSICNLTSLECLGLSDNCLTHIPKKIGNLSNLKYLFLNFNEIQKLPVSIVNLSKLKSLNVSNNKINHLPKKLGNLSQLKILILSNNNLLTLPDISNMKELQFLYLDGNKDLSNLSDFSYIEKYRGIDYITE